MIDVKEKDLNTVKEILKEYVPGFEVRVFGSRVEGRAKLYSDLDLAIVGKDRIAKSVLIQLKDAFQESDLPFRVDVVDWKRISAEFQKIITQNFVVIQS